MSLEKCYKYLYKLSNTDIYDSKFNIYLQKLNYWYLQQVGGDEYSSISYDNFCNSKCNLKEHIQTTLGKCETKNDKCVFHPTCRTRKNKQKCDIHIKDKTCTWDAIEEMCTDSKKIKI